MEQGAQGARTVYPATTVCFHRKGWPGQVPELRLLTRRAWRIQCRVASRSARHQAVRERLTLLDIDIGTTSRHSCGALLEGGHVECFLNGDLCERPTLLDIEIRSKSRQSCGALQCCTGACLRASGETFCLPAPGLASAQALKGAARLRDFERISMSRLAGCSSLRA